MCGYKTSYRCNNKYLQNIRSEVKQCFTECLSLFQRIGSFDSPGKFVVLYLFEILLNIENVSSNSLFTVLLHVFGKISWYVYFSTQ